MHAKTRLLIAMTAFGTIALFVKNIPLPSAEIALYRAVIAAVSIFLYQSFRGNRLNLAKAKKDSLLLLLSGCAMGFNWIFLFEAYRHTTIAIATLAYYFAPVIVMIVSTFLFKERLTKKQVFCFFMSTAGLILILGTKGTEASANHLLGAGLGLGAAVLYATVILLNKGIKNVSGIDRTLMQFLSAIMTLIPYIAVSRGFHLGQLGMTGLANLLILGIFHTAICYCLFFSSLTEVSGQQVAILSYTDPLVAILTSVLILKEGITTFQVMGGLLILGFTLYNEVQPNKKIAEANETLL
ncbi:putative permease [Sphaerochaeta pleomorpha str. Grapes]|uniref:Putative permease n=1 Tax=Sphaerochaeta pleomorpha (strain ATCC BAA-1885 / DSM 22778 / Grapes) TaxID=158190 RepID=G8QSS9_SPHPG|nr:DMT family transporter [Sphaerochaeta pleomorpha]AEV30111.1 putative permease [Sphaerochaeta pleomorpha str. Grapes]